MKSIIAIFLIICRIYIGVKVLWWLFLEMKAPDLHSVSEIEAYLVFVLFDTWVSSSQTDIDIEINKKND